MPSDNLQTLARCRALALAAMVQAGGNPSWVVVGRPATPAAASPAAAPLNDREREILAHVEPRVVAALERLIRHLRPVDVPPRGPALRSVQGRGFERV
jgi:hypothetical protein